MRRMLREAIDVSFLDIGGELLGRILELGNQVVRRTALEQAGVQRIAFGSQLEIAQA